MNSLELYDELVEFVVIDAPDIFFHSNNKYYNLLKNMIRSLPSPYGEEISLIFDDKEASKALQFIEKSSKVEPLILLLICCSPNLQLVELLQSRRCMELLCYFLINCKESRLSNQVLNINENTKYSMKQISLVTFTSQLNNPETCTYLPLILTPLFLAGRMCIEGKILEASKYIWISNRHPFFMYDAINSEQLIMRNFSEKLPNIYGELKECRNDQWGWENYRGLVVAVQQSLNKVE
jgi:hypothetical protein